MNFKKFLLKIVRVITSMRQSDQKILMLIIFQQMKISHENILIYDISYKTLIGSKSLRIRCKKDGFIRIYDETRYLTLFGSEKSGVRYIFSLFFKNLS